MSNSSIPVLKFQFREDFKALKDSLNIQPGYEVEDFNSANDLATFLSTTNAGLVISSLKTRDDLIQLATFMKVVKKVAKDTMVKVVVINFSHDKNFERAIAKIGIQDVVEPGINTKALKFKLDFWMKSLNVQIKNAPSKDGSKVLKQNEAGKGGEKGKGSEQSTPQWVDPLDLENDIWLIKQENDAKKVLSKWLVRILGPSPYVGQWVEVKGGLWRFDLKDHERDMYISGDGAWFYSGDQKPEFVWKENVWLISGDTFDLYFRDPNIIQSRLKAKDKILTICKNSMFAKTKEQMIIESCDKDLVFKREAETLSDMEGKNKTDQLNSDNLSGKSKTDQAGGENLQGKSKTDQLEGGNLHGKTKTGADKSGNLSGELGPSDRITNEDLDQKTKTGKESSYWNGKNAYQKEEGKADFGVKNEGVREGALLDLENNDQDHKKHYKNHNEAQKYDPASLKEGSLGGKSSTDHMAGHYNNDRADKDKKQADERDSELYGKSNTDKLKSHYGNEDKAGTGKDKDHQRETGTEQKRQTTEREKSEFREKEKNDLYGKSETDKLKSHYGNKEKSSAENEKDAREQESTSQSKKQTNEREKAEYDGKSSTDKLGGHYKNAKESGSQESQAKEKSAPLTPQEREKKAKEEALLQEKRNKELPGQKESAFEDDANYYSKKGPSKALGKDSDDEPSYFKEKERTRKEQDEKEEDLYSDIKKKTSSSATKQAQDDEKDSKTKTAKTEGWESNEKYSLKDKKVTSKILTSDESEQDLKSKKDNAAEDTDDFNELIKKNRPERVKPAGNSSEKVEHGDEKEGADVVSLNRARDEKVKAKSPEEARLDEISHDARVTSVILSKGNKVECNLDDFFEDTIVFSTTDTQLNKDSKVTLNMSFKFLDKDTKLNMEGDIQNVEGAGDGTSYVTVSLSRDNVDAFNTFMKLYEARQKHITEFLAKAKGVA